jgi:uncharacterized damage-inducible protein DinB
MTETPAFLADRLKSEGDKSIAFFGSLNDENWEIMVYSEGSDWTVRDVLAHFVSAEQGFIRLFNEILAGGKGAAEDFNIDRYNARQLDLKKDASRQELMKLFRDGRSEMISLVKSLTTEDLKREGRHPFLGISTLAEMIKMVYRHNQIHHRDLRKFIND